MTKAIARVHPVPLMNAVWTLGWPPTPRSIQPTWAESADINGCYDPHPPSPFVIITQPKSWYSFYHPTESGRLSRPRHCRKGAQPGPKAVYHSGCRNKHNCPWPLTPQSVLPSLNHCNLQRYVGVNNLPKVVTQQPRGQEQNSQPSSCKCNAPTTRLPSHLSNRSADCLLVKTLQLWCCLMTAEFQTLETALATDHQQVDCLADKHRWLAAVVVAAEMVFECLQWSLYVA